MIELAEVVSDLRQELDRAQSASTDQELRFELGPIELEVIVGLTKEGGAGGKVRFWVVDIDADLKATSMSTQRIKLTLHPTLPGRRREKSIAEGSLYIGGDEFEDEH